MGQVGQGIHIARGHDADYVVAADARFGQAYQWRHFVGGHLGMQPLLLGETDGDVHGDCDYQGEGVVQVRFLLVQLGQQAQVPGEGGLGQAPGGLFGDGFGGAQAEQQVYQPLVGETVQVVHLKHAAAQQRVLQLVPPVLHAVVLEAVDFLLGQ